jgi:hypothetical protein
MASYGSPPDMPGAPGGGNAQQMVQGPAIGVLVVGIINALYAVYEIISGLMYDPKEAMRLATAQNPAMNKEEANLVTQIMAMSGTAATIYGVVALLLAAIIILSALKMKNLQSFGLAMGGSVLAMIPCLSPCCIAGLPLGIWALIVLNKPEVKSAFR